MGYGFTFDEVNKIFRTNEVKGRKNVISEPEFNLSRLEYRMNGRVFHLTPDDDPDAVLYVEKGKVSSKNSFGKGCILKVSDFAKGGLEIEEDSVLYVFSKNPVAHYFDGESTDEDFKAKGTFDKLYKYWGNIESIVSNEDFAGKKMFLQKMTNDMGTIFAGSLEYHLNKTEAYYLESGRMKVGVRVERAENKSVLMQAGDSFVIPRGLMHCRIPLEDCVLFEISTKDEDSDSHLVEDGSKSYVHREV